MLIVVLLGAFLFYVALYLLWESTQVPLDSLDAVLRALDKMVWVPETVVFMIFRGLLIVATFYVVGDFFVSLAKRTARRREEAKPGIRWKKPPRV